MREPLGGLITLRKTGGQTEVPYEVITGTVAYLALVMAHPAPGIRFVGARGAILRC